MMFIETNKGRTRTALIVAVSLARRYPNITSVSEIADDSGVSISYVEQVLLPLRRANLVRGVRGPGGGYTFTRDPAKVSVADITHVFPHEDESPATDPRTRQAIDQLGAKQSEFLQGINLGQLMEV